MKPQGMCLEEKASLVFPDGVVREGSVWQHTHGAKCIYAAVAGKHGYLFFNLSPQWMVTSHNGNPVYQGMQPALEQGGCCADLSQKGSLAEKE